MYQSVVEGFWACRWVDWKGRGVGWIGWDGGLAGQIVNPQLKNRVFGTIGEVRQVTVTLKFARDNVEGKPGE